MEGTTIPLKTRLAERDCAALERAPSAPPMVTLLTGGFDRPYAFGLAMAMAAKAVPLDVIGSDEVDSPEMHSTPGLNFLNLQGNPRENVSLVRRASKVLIFYARLFRYASVAKPKIFHILWNNKIQLFDRTLLMMYYKLLGKRIVFTAHNVNAGKRDAKDSLFNRLTLRIQYRLMDHIFVHTEAMKSELLEEYGVPEGRVTVIPFGINNAVPNTELTPAEAKRRLGIGSEEKTVLFFGAIRPYKGLEHLVAAFQRIASEHRAYRLIIVGEPKKDGVQYLDDILKMIEKQPSRDRFIQKIEFIPDAETELYFKAADVLALPYTQIFQSGVLFLAYSFGLPVIAADVGSFRDDIVPGKTGYLFRPCDAADLATAIKAYFESHLFKDLDRRRQEIRDFARVRNSWEAVGERTYNVYAELAKSGRKTS